jgi:hypothetical protein
VAANSKVTDPHAGAEALASGQGSASVAAARPGQGAAVDRLVHASFASALDTVMVIVAIIAAVALPRSGTSTASTGGRFICLG